MRCHTRTKTTLALLGPVRRGQLAADERDATVPQRNQPCHDIAHGLFTIHRYARVFRVTVVNQHIGHVRGLQPGQCSRSGGVGHSQQQAIHIARQQLQHRLLFLRQLIVGGDWQNGIARRASGLGDAIQTLGKHRVKQRRQYHAQDPAALGTQTAGAGVGQIAHGAGGLQHAFARGGIHLVGKVKNPRHGGHRYPSL